MRGVAISLIVCAHTLPSLDWSQHPMTEKVLDAIANQTSILFFFIAGYLFQYLSKRFEYRSYLTQKFKTVILPYLLLSIPALIVFVALTPRQHMWPWFYDLAGWQQTLLFLLTGKHLAPLWFVPTITLFYLAAPLFLWIDRQRPQFYWVIVPLMALSIYLGRGGQWGPLNFAQYLLPVYLLGMAFSHYRERAMALVAQWRWPLWALMAVCAAGFIWDWPQPPHYHLPMKMAMALLLVDLLYRFHHHIGNRLDEIAELSFGIFFVHAYFILFLKIVVVYVMEGRVYTGVGDEGIPGNLLTFALYAALVMGVSVASLRLVKRFAGARSRMLVGA